MDVAVLPMTCADVEKLVHPYVDGEFAAEERALVDAHLASCARCRELVAFQHRFKTSLKARLHRPAVPANLTASVLAALDRADARGDGPPLPIWRRAMPVTAALTAVAAILVFVGAMVPSHADSAVVEEAVRCHEKNLPVEVGGGADNVRGYNVLYYRERGVGYVLISDLEPDELIQALRD